MKLLKRFSPNSINLRLIILSKLSTFFMKFSNRHIGINDKELLSIQKTINVSSIDSLMKETIPNKLFSTMPFGVGEAMSESDYLRHIKAIGAKNKVFKTYIGMGYNDTVTPSVIQRTIFENPGWYTQYTPYQAEISQGRLESLLNYQTMISSLTDLPVANASLLDESTAARSSRRSPISFLTIARSGFVLHSPCLNGSHSKLNSRIHLENLEAYHQ